MGRKERSIQTVIAQHEASGKYISVGGLRTFALSYGRGEPVLCLHGVPTSSFLYRKVLSSLSKKGYKGISVDLPGLGLSDRPEDFDYTFSNFSDFIYEASVNLRLKKFHLVVHDIGGPIGFALAARHPQKILSLTILNTWVDGVNFKKPIVMRPFEKKVLGEAQLMMLTHRTWPFMFRTMGVLRKKKIPIEEINTYVDLLKRKDQGKAFLKIMRNFDHSPEFRDLCYQAIQNVNYPIQVLWGDKDPALKIDRYAKEIQKAAGLQSITRLPSRHFLQEETWLAIADKIVEQAQSLHLKPQK